MNVSINILAAFVSPWLFYGGVGAIAAPIIIHLLARRRFRRVRWAAMEFLLEADRQNRRRLRIEQLILLALRCLAVALLALLVARPFVRPAGWTAVIAAPARTHRILLLDDSFSMGHTLGRDSVFELAKDSLLETLAALGDEAPGDPATVLLTSRPEVPVASQVPLTASQLEKLRERLRGLEPSEAAAPMRRAVLATKQSLDQQTGQVNAAVYVFSDFQRVDWIASDSAGPSPLAPLVGWAGQQRSLNVVLVDVGRPNAANRAITSLQIDQPQMVAGVPGKLAATIANWHDQPIEAEELRVFVDQAAQPSIPIPRIEPGQIVHVPLEVTFPEEGWQAVRVETGADSLPIDNARSLALHVVRAVKIVLVNGEPASDPYDDEVRVLKTALRPEGPVFSGNEVQVIEENELARADLGACHVVILANVYRMDETAVGLLERFVASGGGVVFFLGDQVDTGSYNSLLFRDGEGMLPARVGEIVVTAADSPGVRLASQDFTHPATRVFAGTKNPYVGGIYFWQYFACRAAGNEQPTLDEPKNEADEVGRIRPGPASTTTSKPARGASRVVLSFDDDERLPAVIERPYGEGRVMLVATSCDQEWNNWASHPSYVVAMLELVQYMARSGRHRQDVLVGSPIEFGVDVDRFEPRAVLKGPNFPVEPAASLQARPTPETGALRLHWDQTGSSGLYRFELTDRGGPTSTHIVAVNVDPRESDLAKCSESELRRRVREIPFEYVSGSGGVAEEHKLGRRELWPALLVAVIGVLMLEQFLGWWFGRHV